ncbi:MAG: VWA domain-containing protein [Vicinamibacterales bacterium]
MTRVLLVLAVFGAMAAPSRSPGTQAPGPSLRLDLVAVDDHDKPVIDLSPKDLDVRIENYRVPVDTLTAAAESGSERGRLIVLVLDDLAVPLTLTPRVREAAHRFVARMEPGERMAIVSLNGDRMDATADRARLNQRIDAYTVKAAPILRLDDVGAHVLETLTALARQMAEESPGRKTIVGLGAGWLFDTPVASPIGGRDLRKEWTAAMRAMGFANVVLYAIDPGGIGTSRYGGSDGLARLTGGHSFLNTNDLDEAADRILAEARGYYMLTVADPPVGRKFDLRKLEIKSKRKGVTIRARQLIPGTETPQRKR